MEEIVARSNSIIDLKRCARLGDLSSNGIIWNNLGDHPIAY